MSKPAAPPHALTWRTMVSHALRRLGRRYPSLRRLRATASGDRLWRLVADTHRGLRSYDAYRRVRGRERRRLYATDPEPGLLSFITTVWNTEPAYVKALAHTLLREQDSPDFEWVILDNGSTAEGTIHVLQELARDPRVRLERAAHNLGIVGGMRSCLERAAGRYALPLDSDDLLTSDCVRILTAYIRQNDYPALLYTDEDKLQSTTHRDAYFKPDWDPVLFVNSCYIAHLCALDRRRALELGVYTDSSAEGCHDWDTFMRFFLAGHAPVHVPEVVYSWRMHPSSTSGNITAKPFISDSHRQLLSRFVDSRPGRELFEVDRSPLFDGTPDWWIRRRHERPRPVMTVILRNRNEGEAARRWESTYPAHAVTSVLADDEPTVLRSIAADMASRDGLVHLLWSEVQPQGAEWPWEAVGLMELFRDTAIVGGRIARPAAVITAAGCYFGFGRGCDTPDLGRSLHDPGYFAQMWKPHSVSAVSSQHMVVQASFLCEVLEALEGSPASIPYLGAWAGACARRRGRRVVYTPFMLGLCEKDWDALVSDAERQAFVAAHADLMPDARLLSPRLGLDMAASYMPVPTRRRELHLERLQEMARGVTPTGSSPASLPSYPEWLTRRIAQRATQYPAPSEPVRFSVLSTVYEGTGIGLFHQTADSLLAQSYPFFEWVILAHGPVSPALDDYLSELTANPRVTVLRRPVNLGIMGGMRICLEEARGDYIVPVDADDLLTPDALQVFASVLRQKQEPAFVYSDEDILVDGVPAHPYWRPDWDPVLNLSSSYIWHLCAFRRDLAMELGVYTDPGAEWCHDWDSVFRFADAGHAPVHVPEVLYHWRHHRASSTNRQRPDTRSLDATRHILEHRLGSLSRPERYELGLLRLFGDAREWRILRRHVAPPGVDAIIFARSPASAQRTWEHLQRAVPFRFADMKCCAGAADSAAPRLPTAGDLADLLQSCSSPLVVVLSAGVRPTGDDWIWEACRLFECHGEAVLACGQIVDRHGTILAGAGVFDSHGRLRYPDAGHRLGDPGPFALGVKPHSVGAVPTDFFIGDVRFLKSAFAAIPRHAPLDHLGARLGQHALTAGRRVVFSPLIAAVGDGELVDRARDHVLPRSAGHGPAVHLSSVRFLEAQQLYIE